MLGFPPTATIEERHVSVTATPATVDEVVQEAAEIIAKLLDEDPRDQKDIAAAAGISAPQVTHLRKGNRVLTGRMARRLGRVWPEHADQLRALADSIDDAREDAATLPGTFRGSSVGRATAC